MRSIQFPDIFESNSTNVTKSDEYIKATRQNAKLLLSSERNSLLGDPYFGINNYLFEQNSSVLQDALLDTIYTQVALFLPQIKVKRSDIKIYRDDKLGKVNCSFQGINQIDYTTNMYNITIFEQSDMQGA